ncbi:MAG: helix-turn-helix domain-containing protein, partial [Bacillota bacterium]
MISLYDIMIGVSSQGLCPITCYWPVILSPHKRSEKMSPMKGDVFLKPKEARRLGIMERILAGKVSIRQAAVLLGLSERQVMRLKKGMKQEGEAFLVHKNRG